jgi:hypothetical protein
MPNSVEKPAAPEVKISRDKDLPPAAELVTHTGRHPAVVVKQPSTAELVLGFVVDLVVVVGLFVLMALRIITATEGLPWVALVVGGKLVALRRRTPPANGSATLSLLGV